MRPSIILLIAAIFFYLIVATVIDNTNTIATAIIDNTVAVEVKKPVYEQGILTTLLEAERGERITEVKYKLYMAKLTTYDGLRITSTMSADTVDIEFATSKLDVIKTASWYGNFKRRSYGETSKND